MTNLFLEAKQLLKKKDSGSELTEEELELINTATIPLMLLPEYNNIPINQGLEKLAKILEEVTE